MGQAVATLKQACAAKNLRYVGGRGSPKSRLWVIGEAPGADEDAQGVPFVGASGQEQDRMLSDAGISAGEAYFTNVGRVKPPANDFDKLEELGVPRAQHEAALFEELAESQPPVIVTAGATSTSLLLPQYHTRRSEEVAISHLRGSLLGSPKLSWPHYVVPCQHPAFVLREWAERQVSVFCYARAWEELTYWRQHNVLAPLPVRSLAVQPDYASAMAWLETRESADAAVTLDLEMTPSRSASLRWKTVFLIGLACSASDAISLRIWDYPTPQARTLLRKVNNLLRTKIVVGHNAFNFDYPWVETIGLLPEIKLAEDTRVLHHVLYPEFSHKLEFLTMQFTREPYYKSEGRGINCNSPADLLRYGRYNAMDCCVTYEAWEAMKRELQC